MHIFIFVPFCTCFGCQFLISNVQDTSWYLSKRLRRSFCLNWLEYVKLWDDFTVSNRFLPWIVTLNFQEHSKQFVIEKQMTDAVPAPGNLQRRSSSLLSIDSKCEYYFHNKIKISAYSTPLFLLRFIPVQCDILKVLLFFSSNDPCYNWTVLSKNPNESYFIRQRWFRTRFQYRRRKRFSSRWCAIGY